MHRQPEPEIMDLPDEVRAYAMADFDEVNRAFVDRLTELADEHFGGEADGQLAALDLGCGPGDIARRVAIARPKWQITAADASGPMLDWAAGVFDRAGIADRVVGRQTDAKSTGFSDRSFDVVFSNSLLHHLTDAVAMWREVKRIIRPGGLIFFRDLYRPPDSAAAWRIVDAHAAGESSLLREEFHRSLLSGYRADEIAEQLKSAGLSGLRVKTINDRHVDILGRIQGG